MPPAGPQERATARDNDAFIMGVEKRLRCTCGCNLDVYTCRTTDFSCGVSPRMHREVLALQDQGQNEKQIVDTFVARYGEVVLMAPKPEGFNLAGYFVPGVVVLLASGALAWYLRRRSLVAAAEGPKGGPWKRRRRHGRRPCGNECRSGRIGACAPGGWLMLWEVVAALVVGIAVLVLVLEPVVRGDVPTPLVVDPEDVEDTPEEPGHFGPSRDRIRPGHGQALRHRLRGPQGHLHCPRSRSDAA